MKDELKDFIGKNREAFDDKEPSENIWPRIEQTLPGIRQRSLWSSAGVWRIAATLFLGLSVYLLATRPAATTSSSRNDVAQGQREFSDMELYYRNEIAQKVELINHYDATGESDQITQSFQKLDAMYLVLTEELKNNPDPKVKDAMILNLLVRIDLLNQQLHTLEKKSRPAAEV